MFFSTYKLNRNNLKLIIILFLYWVSLNTGSKYISLTYEQYFDLNTLSNLIRSLFPYLIFIYLIFNKKYLKNFLSNYDFVFICFLFYGIFQLSGLLYTTKNMHEHYWLVCLFSLIIYYKNILNNEQENTLNLIFLINLFFIFLLFITFTSFIFKENFFIEKALYNSRAFTIEFANESIPRSSGISRMGLILFIFLNSIYFFYRNKISKNYKFLIFFINILLIFIVFAMQSRGAILSFFILFVLINLIYNFKSIKERIIYGFLIIFIPVSLFFFYPILKNYLIQTYSFQHPDIDQSDVKKNLNYKKYFRKGMINTDQNLELSEKIIISSNNRVNAWRVLIDVFFTGKIS